MKTKHLTGVLLELSKDHPKTHISLVELFSKSLLDEDQLKIDVLYCDTTPDWVRKIYEKENASINARLSPNVPQRIHKRRKIKQVHGGKDKERGNRSRLLRSKRARVKANKGKSKSRVRVESQKQEKRPRQRIIRKKVHSGWNEFSRGY